MAVKASAPRKAVTTQQQQLVLQRACACDEREIQRKSTDDADVSADNVRGVMSSNGQPLEPRLRTVMERAFGYDFSTVRVHTDTQAAASARALHATAYTSGRDVVFADGAYAPQSEAGRRLIAHELTHVVQQASGPVAGRSIGGWMRLSDPGDSFERQADAMAATVTRGAAQPARVSLSALQPASAPAIQRQRHRASASASRGAAIVADNQTAAAGQMRQSDFLFTLRDRLREVVDAEFQPYGRSARDCPYVLRTIERYEGRSVAALMRLIRAYAHPPAGADAQGLIAAVVARTRSVARRVAARQGPRAQAALEPGAVAMPAHEPAAIRRQLGSGHALDTTTRTRMEESFGTSLASVRIHDDPVAARFNHALGARAFTIGQDIAFSSGAYEPGTTRGQRLLAHELAHTIQQGFATGTAAHGGEAQLERDADRAADAVIGREPTSLRSTAPGLRIQRAPVVLAGALIVAEATPEIIVAGEIGADVVLVDGAVTVTADVALVDTAAVPVLETAAPVLETAAPVLETAAPTVAATTSTATTVATATVGVGAAVGLSSDSPQQQPDEQRPRCEVYPLGYHRGPNTNGHHTCADLRNIYPGSDVQVDSPVGSKAFDALDAQGTLWEIKTDQYSTWNMPQFLKDQIVQRDAIEMTYELGVATACGYPFTIGVTDPGYAAALLAIAPMLPAVSIIC